MTDTEKLIKLLNLSDDDVLKALLSVYSPCQPGALQQSWNNRKNYGPAPTAKEIWQIYEKYDFRCSQCKSQYRISIDHIDNQPENGTLENLQLLCQSCNRKKQKRGIKNENVNIKIFKSLMKLFEKSNDIPKNQDVFRDAETNNGGSGLYVLKFLIHRLKNSLNKGLDIR